MNRAAAAGDAPWRDFRRQAGPGGRSHAAPRRSPLVYIQYTTLLFRCAGREQRSAQRL